VTRQTAEYRFDEVDRRILHALMRDARNTTAAEIAERANVSGATIRNRIRKMEETGVVRGNTADLDFERIGGKLTNLYTCNVPVAERASLAREARAIPGVIDVRSLMTGRRNLHVVAVGDDTEDLQRVARGLSRIGIDIEDEDLVEDEFSDPYSPFDPEEGDRPPEPNDVISLTGDADVVEVTVDTGAPIDGLTLEAADSQDVIDDGLLVIAIERDDRELTPDGETVVRADDIVTLLSRGGSDADALEAFQRSSPVAGGSGS
jgi:DNA-binding Lrp family transcriptional regulator